MFKQSENIAHRLFNRQISRSRPNTHIHQSRKFYENIVPSHTIYDVECPDHIFRKFTNDGQYLICFGRNQQDLIVYRHNWLNFCVTGESSDNFHEPALKSRQFESYFSQLYAVPLALGSEVICNDFFLSTENGLYGIFATLTGADNLTTHTDGAVPGVPSIEKITFCMVRLADGCITDQREYENDFIQLSHNMGVFLYDDLLAILSIRLQCIRLLQVRETGKFVDIRTIGAHCHEDDELVLNSQAQDEDLYQKKHAAIRKSKGLLLDDEATVPRNVHNLQERSWPPSWNMMQPQASRPRHRGRSQMSSRSSSDPNLSMSGHSGRAVEGSNDPGSSGGLDEVLTQELDIQYDGYFRGLFDSLEDPAESNGGGTSLPVIGSSGRSEILGTSALAPLIRNNLPLANESQTSNFPVDPDISTSGSGAQHSSSGLSQFERSYSSTSGDNLDRSSGSWSMSTLYTSTTITSSDSGSRSESSRRDGSLSAGSTRYGSEPVSVRSAKRTVPEYVVSGRNHDRVLSRQQASPHHLPLPNSSHLRTEERSFNEAMTDYGRSFASSTVTGLGNRHGLGHRPIAEDPTPLIDLSSQPGPPIQATVTFGDSEGTRRTGVIHRQSRHARSDDDGLGNGLHRNRAATSTPIIEAEASQMRGRVLGGIKQRLLSFIVQGVWDQDVNPNLKAQRLKRFYYHFQHYVDLVMWKVQFLDRYHLLIKFGSVEGMLQRNSDTSQQTAFFAIYNLETTEMLGFYQNSSEDFLLLFEHFCDHFRVPPQHPFYMNFISSYSNNSYALYQFRNQKTTSCNKAGSSQIVKRSLAGVPFNAQCQSPSPYFDMSLFHYDETIISAKDRHRSCSEHPIKFISRRRPNLLKFKINAGLKHGSNDSSVKRVVSFIFHPIFPFAISIQQSFMQPPILNFHLRI